MTTVKQSLDEVADLFAAWLDITQSFFDAADGVDIDPLWKRDRDIVINQLRTEGVWDEEYEEYSDDVDSNNEFALDHGYSQQRKQDLDEFTQERADGYFLGAIGEHKGAQFVVWTNLGDFDGMNDVLIVRRGNEFAAKVIQTN